MIDFYAAQIDPKTVEDEVHFRIADVEILQKRDEIPWRLGRLRLAEIRQHDFENVQFAMRKIERDFGVIRMYPPHSQRQIRDEVKQLLHRYLRHHHRRKYHCLRLPRLAEPYIRHRQIAQQRIGSHRLGKIIASQKTTQLPVQYLRAIRTVEDEKQQQINSPDETKRRQKRHKRCVRPPHPPRYARLRCRLLLCLLSPCHERVPSLFASQLAISRMQQNPRLWHDSPQIAGEKCDLRSTRDRHRHSPLDSHILTPPAPPPEHPSNHTLRTPQTHHTNTPTMDKRRSMP